MSETETMVISRENRRRWNPIRELLRVAYRVVLHPGVFYEQLPRQGSYASALVFLFSCSLLFSILGSLYVAQEKMSFALIYFLNAFFMPFITALFLYLVTLLFCKGTYTYQTLFGVTAYANVTLLAAWIPGLAWMTGIWKFYLIGLGLVKVGRISASKAIFSLLAAAAMLLFLIQLSQPILRH